LSKSRIMRALVVATLVSLVLVPVLPAGAAGESAASIAAQIKKLNSKLAGAGRAYEKAQWALEDNEYDLRKTNRQLKTTQVRLAKAKKQLLGRATDIYRAGSIDVMSVLFESSSIDSFLTRMSYFEAIAGQDAASVADVKQLTADLKAQKKHIAQVSARMKGVVAARAKRKQQLQGQLASKQADYAKLKARLAAAMAAEKAAGRSTYVEVSRGSNGMVFPVAGANYYSDTFGAPRSGGRSHKGTDIMANDGVPVVATTDGSVSSKQGGLGGKVIWLEGSGWRFYYAHLSGWKVRSGSVKAGQVIGYVGSTGNASGGAAHLHFEMHPGGGGAVNPYPYLRAMQ
jgi:murein DD-endopeptidase MepM/ murein hydrolase activator NlpD